MHTQRSVGLLAIIGIASAALVAGCGGGAAQHGQSDQSGQPGQSDQPGQSGQQSDNRVVVGMTYIPNVQFSPVYVAAADGIFAQHGVGAELRHHGTEEGLFTALVAGDEQMTIASGDEVLQARSSGADLVAIGAYYHQYPVEVIIPEKSDITTMSDLRGKRIGLPGEFGSNWFGLQAALENAGLTTSDVQVVSVGYTQAASLVAGDVDAIVGFSNSEAVQLQQMGFPVRALPLDAAKTPLVGATIVTTRSWLDQHPDLARGAVASITAGVQEVIDNPESGLEATKKWDQTLTDPKAAEGAKATLEATIPLWKSATGKASAVQDLQTWQGMAPFLARVLGDPTLTQQVDGAVTNDVAQ